MHSDHAEMKELATRICRDYLNGAWKDVTPQTIGFKHISGGLSNLLYHISLPEDAIGGEKYRGEPKEVLIRVYGQTHGDADQALACLITESVVFTLLSERGLGPKLHGIFPGGRIEEYINARTLQTHDLHDPLYSRLIAEKMAMIHQMEVPLHKEPTWLWQTLHRWLNTWKDMSATKLPPDAQPLQECDLHAEARWIRQTVDELHCPVAFCHNDMQEGNILSVQDENENNYGEPRLVIIDFEYCSYNYRSFDLANHFLEWVYDYTHKSAPYYKATMENYPSEAQRLHFIHAYLKEQDSDEDPQVLMHEVRVFTLVSHLFWTLWSIVNAETSKIPFGYWDYGICRMRSYQKAKAELQQYHKTHKRKADSP